MFALVDCNNFYASCERVFRPDLNGKPVVVLSNNDGCVIARSNEAKAIGIPMGAPAFENEKLFKDNSVYLFSANFVLYGDMSQRVMSILEEYTPNMEIYSIDEAFLNLKGFEHLNFYEYGGLMRLKVFKWTGIPVSVGIASTKTLAKAANHIAKKFPKETHGVHVIDSEEKKIKALRWLKIEDVWGVGRQHTKRLNQIGVKTAYDFTKLDDSWIRKNMSIVGLRLKQELLGVPALEIEVHQIKQSIATTRTFESNYTKREQLKERIVTFAVSCAEKLRMQKSCCNSMMVFIHSNRHRADLPQNSRNIVVKLPYATNSSIELAKFSSMALDEIFKEGYSYKKAGVVLLDFTPEQEQQLTLFENRNKKHIQLMQVIDRINSLYGQQKVRLAAQDPQKIWKMKQEKLSPAYTTKLSDIIKIHC